MPTFTITAPDGKEYDIDAPEGASAEQALSYFQSNWKQPQPAQPEAENGLMQGLRGFSARGNQAMAALNPWADQQKIAAEQEWVKQHPAAQIGQGLADIAITAPAGGLATAPARALASGAIEAATMPGGAAEKLKNYVYGALGAGTGEVAAKGLSAAIQPFKPVADTVRQELVNKAIQMGLPLNAADITGNKTLQYAASALESLPASSASMQAANEAKRRAWEKAIFAKGGEIADRPTESVMGAMKSRISSEYNDIAARNKLLVDSQFKADLANIEQKYLERIPTNQKNVVQSYLNDFATAPEGAFIKGSQYQDIRSMLDKQSKAFKNSDPVTYQALKDIREAADSAMMRNISSPEDAARLSAANKDWMVMKSIEESMPSNAATSRYIDPNAFANALRKRDSNAMIYGTGNQDMADLAKVGKQFVSAQTSESGTAPRQMVINVLKGAPLVAAGEEYGRTGGDVTSAALPIALGYGLPKVAAKMIQNPSGYLSEGLIDMTKGNREKILADILRNAAIASNFRDQFKGE